MNNEHSEWPAWKISEQVGVSDIKVQRIRKELQNKDESFKYHVMEKGLNHIMESG